MPDRAGGGAAIAVVACWACCCWSGRCFAGVATREGGTFGDDREDRPERCPRDCPIAADGLVSAGKKPFREFQLEIDILRETFDESVGLEQRRSAGKDGNEVIAIEAKQNLNGLNDEPIFFDEGFIDGERAGDTPQCLRIRRVRE